MDQLNTMDLIFNRMPNYHPKFPIILMWSHNSGCTPLLSWFFYQNGLLENATQYHPWIHQYEVNVYKKDGSYSEELAKALLKKEKKVYKLVCNPYIRTVNCFLMLYYNDEPYWYDVQQAIKNYPNGNSDKENSVSFKQFLYYLKDVGVKASSTNSHFAEQYIDGEEHYVDQIIYLENLSRHLAEFEKKYGLKKTNNKMLIKQNFSRYMKHEGQYAEVSLNDPSFPVFPTYMSFYDEETKRLVDEIFHRDFVKYRYQKRLSFNISLYDLL